MASGHPRNPTSPRHQAKPWFWEQARAGCYPNAASLAERFGVRRDTAKDWVRGWKAGHRELRYDRSRRGYRLGKAAEARDEARASAEIDPARVAASLARAFLRRQLPDLPEPLLAFADADASPDAFLVTHSVAVPVDTEILRRIVDATIRRQRLTFDYASPWADGAGAAAESAREVSPWLVQLHDGRPYLHGYCHDREAQRCFQLALMSRVAVNELPARERPRALRQRAEKSFGLAAASAQRPLTAKVRLHGGWAQWVEHERWHDEQADRWDGDVLTRRFRFVHIDEAVRRLLPGGGEVEVVSPGELRAAFRGALRAGVARNSGDRFGRNEA